MRATCGWLALVAATVGCGSPARSMVRGPDGLAIASAARQDPAARDGLPDEIDPMPISPGPLPTPPSQGQPWIPPPGTPDALREATERAFALGLPDPRGCEYRAIAVHVGRDAWTGDRGIARTRGWVLPGAGEGPRWAIVHSGFLYAVAAVGPPVDLDEAVASPQPWCDRRQATGGDEELLSVGCGFGLLQALQLARVGRVDLARRVMPAAAMQDPDGLVGAVAAGLSREGRGRALGAHIRGDDVAALHTLRIAARASALAGPVRPMPLWPMQQSEDDTTLIEVLLRDHERRALAPRVEALELDAPAIPERIARWIGAMDQVGGMQSGQPGGMAWSDDPIVQALARSGGAAVAPLIDVIERDDRLTRSVWAWRDFAPGRELQPVRVVAEHLVRRLLGMARLPAAPDRASLAAALRTLQAEHASASDRHLATLRDPSAPLEDVARAAHELARPLSGPWSIGFSDQWAPGTPPAGARVGDALRPAHDDEVAARLGEQLERSVGAEAVEYRNSCTIASALVQWQPTVRPLRALFERCRSPNARCGACLAGLAVALSALDDRQVLDQYAERLRAQPPRGVDVGALVEPILRHPEVPSMRALARWMMTDAPWAASIRARWGRLPGAEGVADPDEPPP